MDLTLGNLKPSVCIDAVFEGIAVDSAVKATHQLGYSAFEFWCWWEKDLIQVKELCQTYSMSVASCCTKFVSLTQPELRDEYLEGLRESIEAAKQLSCNTLISQVGDFMVDRERESQHDSLVLGLCEAAKLLDGTGIALVIEPLNEQVDHPGYYLTRSDEAFQIIDEVDSPNVKVVYDIYHQQITEGNLISNILKNLQKIGHFHAAGNPGRHELNRGEINYPQIFGEIANAGFEGYVGLEYWPVDEATLGLTEVANWFANRQSKA